LQLALDLHPDVTIMDIGMPGADGINATRRLVTSSPNLHVIALSTHAERHFITQMLSAGAKGYIIKSSGVAEMVKGIRAVSEGRTYLCQQAANAMAETLRPNVGGGNCALARREMDVLRLLAEGNTSEQIGERLHIARGTVDVHRRNIMRKLGLHTVAELTQYAIREGVISL
jgi:DNA-binding NarL/FixJ family response regulator